MSTFKRASSRRNVPRLYVQAIFALAAALALSTSACGKKEDGAQPVPATQPAPAPTAATNTDKIGTVAGTKPKSELDQQSSKSAMNKEKRGEGTATSGKTGEGEEGNPLAKLYPSETGDEVQSEEPAAPAPQEPDTESVVYYDPNGMTKDQMATKKAEVIEEGALFPDLVRSDIMSQTGEALYYSGSGHDDLRNRLYTMVNALQNLQDERTRAGDKELAQTVQLANFKVDWESRRAEFNFTLEGMNEHRVYRRQLVIMKGPIDNLNRFKVRTEPQHPIQMSAEVACVDIDGGCKTVQVRVRKATKNGVQTAHMIARKTNAKLVFRGNAPTVARNAEYDRLIQILMNTKERPTGYNVFENVTMTTSETIGGASNFAVTMRTRLMDAYGNIGGDTLELTGPLAKPRNHEYPKVAVNVSPALTVINNEMVPTEAIGVQNRMVTYLKDPVLTRNDGRGTLEFEMTVRAADVNAREDKIWLRIDRIHTPTTAARIKMQ